MVYLVPGDFAGAIIHREGATGQSAKKGHGPTRIHVDENRPVLIRENPWQCFALALILWHARVDVIRPGRDAALEIR
jgi:hypothetical protein